MFVCALHENVTFISKRYSKHSIRITFEIHKKRTVVIDPGHGGKDPGASGITGNCEKNITMVTAVELRNALLKSGKYKVVLTRERDMFITNEERINKIKAANADFLISLHTDSNKDTNIRGMTVYTLPKLDVIRNAAGVDNIKDYCKILGQSEKFAKLLVRFFPNTCKMSNQPCRNSEFKVLKADVPAVLIELGCISNKIDNELLHSREFREKTIMAIQYALDSFLGDDKQ
jgi:N-acetylmuramoyl-L-alanine amidase